MAHAVTVAVRCRPLSKKEIHENSKGIIVMDKETTTITDPQLKQRPLPFKFDYSFMSTDPSSPDFASQKEVYDKVGTTLLCNAFEGYNACLFAYGQTGSGKTYTMMGYGEDKGVIPRLCSELFEQACQKQKETNGEWKFIVTVSYLEIYNERCRCLLSPNSQHEFKVREHPVTGPYVENLTKIVVASFEEIEKLMDEGNKVRTVAATAMNATSSRSHAIFTVNLVQQQTHKALDNATSEMSSKINLVDLAGSERADRTGATGQTLKEGSNINKSLTTLGKVIHALAEGVGADGKFKKHVPFRDSALTWLLKENLCGNSKTAMIAALSPADSNYEETVSTLRYADRAKSLKTQAVVNEDPTSRTIRELRAELEMLKAKLEARERAQEPPSPQQPLSPSSPSSPRGHIEYESLTLEQKFDIAKKLLEEESKSWEERASHSKQVQALRASMTKQLGIAVRAANDRPSFVNLNEDPSMSECLVYSLSLGTTKIGKAVEDREQDIFLDGEGIQDLHATIEIQDGEDENAAHLSVLTPAEKAEIHINGHLITEATALSHGDRVIFGTYQVFRFVDPRGRLHHASPTTGVREAFDYHRALEERFEAERSRWMSQSQDNSMRCASSFVLNVQAQSENEKLQEIKLQEMEKKLAELEERAKSNLSHRYLLHTSVEHAVRPALITSPSQREGSPGSAARQSSLVNVAQIAEGKLQRLPNEQIFRHKLVLLGHQEVGKTSLRKCFDSDPIFFFGKKLPDVKSTTGIELQQKILKVGEDKVELCLSDFAGQESYHSHTLFLTDRSIFMLVWKISAIEQDYMSSGISEHEEDRMRKWLSEVYAKFPDASLILCATHLDELRDQSQRGVEFILHKVEKMAFAFIEKVAKVNSSGHPVQMRIIGNFAVSCKTRSFIAAGSYKQLSGQKLSALLQIVANTAHQLCVNDEVFWGGAVPGRHIRLMQEIEKMKKSDKMLLSLGEYVHIAVRFGVESDLELLQVSQLMHSWNIIFLFNTRSIGDNIFIFLHPMWLSKMAGTLFSFSHVVATPFHLRSIIGGLEYTVTAAMNADRGLLARGYFRLPLAKVIFRSSLAAFLKKEPEDLDYDMCIQLLIALELMYKVEVSEHDASTCMEESATPTLRGSTPLPAGVVWRYFVPSLSPCLVPPELRMIAPVLFHRGLHLRFDFNMLPDEFWWRLQFRLSHHSCLIAVRKPKQHGDDDDSDEDSSLLDQAFEEHNRWKDGMWLATAGARVFLMKEGQRSLRLFSAELDSHDVEKLMESVEDAFTDLLQEYQGIQRTVFVACPVQGCCGWHKIAELEEKEVVLCRLCKEEIPVEAIVASGTSPIGPRVFSQLLIRDTLAILESALDAEFVPLFCDFFGIRADRTKISSGSEERMDCSEMKLDFLTCVDKVVRTLMLRASWQRQNKEVA